MNLEQRVQWLEHKMRIMEQEILQLRSRTDRSVPPVAGGPQQHPSTGVQQQQHSNMHSPPPPEAMNGPTLHPRQQAPLHGPQLPPSHRHGNALPRPPYVPPQPKKPTDWEHLIARVWLPRIFIVVLLLGVLWGFIAAVSEGYLTKPVRCILGLLAAGVMYWLGEKQIRSKREALGQVLLGGSIAVSMLSFFSAHYLYELIPSWLAFVLYILSIALGVFTAIRHRSQTLTIIMMLAGYLVPFLVHSTSPNAWVFVGYEVIFSVAMMIISIRYSYRVAYFVAFGVLHLPLLIGYLSGNFDDSRYVFILAVFLLHAAQLAMSLFRPYRHLLDEKILLGVGFALTLFWNAGLYGNHDTFLNPLMLIGWALIYSLVTVWRWMTTKDSELYLVISTFSWFLWIIDVFDFTYVPVSIILLATLAIALGFYVKSQVQQIISTVIYVIGFVYTLSLGITDIFSANTISWLVLLLSLASLSVYIRSNSEEVWKTKLSDGIMWLDSLLFIIFITQITNVLTDELSYDMQHLILSAIWALYSISMIIIGIVIQKSIVRLAGILFLLFTLLKVIFFDLPGVSIGVRAILFIGLGMIGIAISRLMYRRKSDSSSDPAHIEPETKSDSL
ncbi:DUF2339 domain-containing protein [Paenibacillus pini]|uniref:DUF2339 domain-containing protein n=1 Tax=Paenibacillus pini JCM 16418 TaxID=1236976 RepID=W7YJA3_9BACL|nr:DUF2339 domain-containing protein [Paenibacillus pini]GAF08557.1 hypothetical protein JCM16418_2640 [Paenibacillus pini JCM 16418]